MVSHSLAEVQGNNSPFHPSPCHCQPCAWRVLDRILGVAGDLSKSLPIRGSCRVISPAGRQKRGSLDRCGHLQPEGCWRSGRCQGCVACTGEDAACAGLSTLNGQCHRCPGHPCGNSIKRVASPSAGIYWHVIIMLLFVRLMT